MSQVSQAAPTSNRMSFDAFQRYCAEVPSDLLDEQGELLDWLIGMAFDTLEARILDLRILPATLPLIMAEI